MTHPGWTWPIGFGVTIKLLIGGLAVCAALFALHLLAVWAENRGWIYYRKGRGRNWSAGAAAQELQSLLQPASRHVIEESKREALERHDAQDPSDD